jgi:hypothetical protein
MRSVVWLDTIIIEWRYFLLMNAWHLAVAAGIGCIEVKTGLVIKRQSKIERGTETNIEIGAIGTGKKTEIDTEIGIFIERGIEKGGEIRIVAGTVIVTEIVACAGGVVAERGIEVGGSSCS